MNKYTPENAGLYNKLGIEGTSYEISFNEVSRLMGDLSGKTALDFGTGTGRSALLLKSLGARRVIGVDRDTQMVAHAKTKAQEGIQFHQMGTTIPLPDKSVDTALSTYVFNESRTKEEMSAACKEVFRVLKDDGTFVVVVINSETLGYDFVTYRYLPKDNPKSGDKIICRIKGEQEFDIEDTYWTEQDYREVLQGSGFRIEQTTKPLATGPNWLDETKIPPDIFFKCSK